MAARPQGWPSGLRVVITATPDASEDIASTNSSCSSRAGVIPSVSKAGSSAPPTRACLRSRRGSVAGWSVRWCAPRLSARARHAAAIRRASGNGSPCQLLQARGVALQPGVAPQRRARGLRRQAGLTGGGGGSGRRGGRRLGGGRHRGAPAVDEALGERVGGQPVGSVQPAAGALAHRVEARQRGAPVEVGGHAAHRVVGGRGHGHRLAGRVDAHLGEHGGDVGKASEVDVPEVEPHRPLAAARQLRLDREGHVIARRQLVHEALAGRRRAASPPRRAPPR